MPDEACGARVPGVGDGERVFGMGSLVGREGEAARRAARECVEGSGWGLVGGKGGGIGGE